MVYVPPREAPPANAGVYLGTITRVTGDVCYLEVPALAPGFEYGPAQYPATGISAGDRVACSFLGGAQDDGVVVLVQLA